MSLSAPCFKKGKGVDIHGKKKVNMLNFQQPIINIYMMQFPVK